MTLRLTAMVFAIALLGSLHPADGRACPLCDSSQAVEVRSGLADDFTPTTLAAVAAPFIIVASVVGMVHFGMPNYRSKR